MKLCVPVCACVCVLATYNAFLVQAIEHDDRFALLLPAHLPKVLARALQRPLAQYVLATRALARHMVGVNVVCRSVVRLCIATAAQLDSRMIICSIVVHKYKKQNVDNNNNNNKHDDQSYMVGYSCSD